MPNPKGPEYVAWVSMKTRCHNPRSLNYRGYGSRGIKVCVRWLHSFANFLADMGPRPSKLHSLDRIDNDGNYNPGNCRWATHVEQQQNTRNNRRLTYNGETLCLSEWARRLGIGRTSLRCRLRHYPADIALSVGKLSRGGAGVVPGAKCGKRPRTSTGYKGVYRNGSRFDARLHVGGRVLYLGMFRNPEAAAAAYNAAAVAAFGDYARLNQLPGDQHREVA